MCRLLSHRLFTLEARVLLSILTVAGSAGLFLALTGEVTSGEPHALDAALLHSLRAAEDSTQPIGPGWLHQLMQDFTTLGNTTFLTAFTTLTVLYLLIEKKFRHAGAILLSIVGGALLVDNLKELIGRPRPTIVPHLVEVSSLSFPSGHAAMAAVTYLTLAVLLARSRTRRRTKAYILTLGILLPLCIGLSRVYLGVHWPTDVLAGWCMGAGWALLCKLVFESIMARKHAAQKEVTDTPLP